MSYLNERAKQFFNSKIKDYLIKVEDGTEFINIKRTDLYHLMNQYRTDGNFFSPDEIESMRNQAYEAGYDAGMEECGK